MSALLDRDLFFLVLQYLNEAKFMETAHRLERESGYFFDLVYFGEAVLAGDWHKVERYLSGFTKLDDNRYSTNIYFVIRKQKYLEALDRHDKAKALDILVKDLKVFSTFNNDAVKDFALLLLLDNFSLMEYQQLPPLPPELRRYDETLMPRVRLMGTLKKLIEANPLFKDKLEFPPIMRSRLHILINQSLEWQHERCQYPSPKPEAKTLFVDHRCPQPNVAPGPSSPAPSQRAAAAHAVSNPAVYGAPLTGLATPPPAALACHTADSERGIKRPRLMGTSEKVGSFDVARSQHTPHELPSNVAIVLKQDSAVTSMDFHPAEQSTVLLVGTTAGEISLWNVASCERIAHRSFKVWHLGRRSASFHTALAKDPTVSVNRVIWNFDGTQFGVAFSQHLVHLFTYNGRDGISNHLEIEAHVGGINDAAYSQPNGQVCIVTGGEDKTIRVWDAAIGTLRYTFEGHETPVYSICPHPKEDVPVLFSTSLDGKIKAWMYDNVGSRLDYTIPGQWNITLAYSADGARLFSCGAGKDLMTHIVELNDYKGTIMRSYHGLCKQAMGKVKFDTTKNWLLAAGDEYMVKFWDMDNTNLLKATDAEGDLPALPCIRFNKAGSLLAVSANNNRIKILANVEGEVQLILNDEQASGSSPKALAGTSASGA